MNPQEALAEAKRKAGGIGSLARALEISSQAVGKWDRVPAERVLKIEELTGVPRTALRPDLYPADG